MQEDTNESEVKVSEPQVQSPQPQAQAQALSTPQQTSTLMKDLLIPISIVIAGIAVGAGMYFSGGAAQPGANGLAAAEPVKAVDNTGKINPVTESDHIKGNPDAPIKIVEYSDFDCPFCSRFHDSMKIVTEKYGDNVAWVYRQFPLEQLHPQAPAVAVASECVAELGGNDAFWVFTDGYFAARGAGDNTAHGELIAQLVTKAGVSSASFTECFDSGRHITSVQADMDNAIETGGGGTPWSILIGPSGKTYPINGALPQQAIEQVIELAKKEA